jgi:predicted transcriptional regulator
MDLPIEVINAVKPKLKARKPYVKKITKRILHAIGNGLRTPTSIANALGLPKAKIQSNLSHLKTRGLLYSHKQVNSNEHKYHLTTDKPVLDKLDLTKPKRTYTKRKSTYNKAGVNTTNSFNTPPKAEPQPLLGKYARELEVQVANLTGKLTSLEHTLIEKEKEVWTLECEVFDKKAIIKYLEEKLFVLGVRV